MLGTAVTCALWPLIFCSAHSSFIQLPHTLNKVQYCVDMYFFKVMWFHSMTT
jgi:hypothetical protein